MNFDCLWILQNPVQTKKKNPAHQTQKFKLENVKEQEDCIILICRKRMSYDEMLALFWNQKSCLPLSYILKVLLFLPLATVFSTHRIFISIGMVGHD